MVGFAGFASTLFLRAAELPGHSRQAVSYYGKIKPLLAVHCAKCHGSETQKSGLRLDDSGSARAGGKSGAPAIVPGSSGQSDLVRRIMSRDPDEQMPPKGARLTEEEISLIRRWIDEGANWPERDDYWAFQPPTTPAIPAAGTREVSRNPIDRFIASRLAAARITPVSIADALTLLRRAYADLIGVPPSPEEAEIFLRDRSPDAWEKRVDRLLGDPRYGERWARHWLDLVRYGESDGYEDDKIRPHAWRYRDYVIRSLNVGKSYDRFVQEQIAGDELWPDDPEAWVATGFARLGSWDAMSKEPMRQRQDFLNDATDAAGSVFLGMTIGCARCHDHKYDAITQQDYYRLQAFFAPVKREARELKGDLPDPPGMQAAYKSESDEAGRLQREREELLRLGRQHLEKEIEKGEASHVEAKPKIDDAAVKKRVESLQPGRLRELEAKIKTIENRRRFIAPKAEATFIDGSKIPKTFVLKGGELNRPGPEVHPGLVEAMLPNGNGIVSVASHPGEDSRASRAALALWLTSADHPLAARVLVNRLWQHHFGAGIVATPSDFGRNGRPPTHPELLDWLARYFIREGFDLKKMHRLIMTSAAYRRSSAPNAAAAAKDPENKLLWRMNRHRLEGEAIRDTILAVSGDLEWKMGGPGVYARLAKGVAVELPNNDKELSWEPGSDDDNRRRSIYLFQRRSLTFPLMDVFDAAPMSQSCSIRSQTTVPTQALALFNGEFSREAAVRFAERLQREAGMATEKQIERAYLVAFARRPTRPERAAAQLFLREQTATRRADGVAAAHSALIDFCHVMLNASELIY